MNTFNAEFANRAINHDYNLIKKQEFITKLSKEMLVEYLPKNKKINFMSVDVEGFDLEVLKSNDFNLFRKENYT